MKKKTLSCTQETATISLILNVFLPGVGTIIVAFAAEQCNKSTVIVSIAQILLAPLLIGWIWSITWSFLLTRKIQRDALITQNMRYDRIQNATRPVSLPQRVATIGNSGDGDVTA